MKKRQKYWLLLLGALLGFVLLAKLSMTFVNDWAAGHARIIVRENDFPPMTANSFKHAFMAAYGYALLRNMGASPDFAEDVIESAGYANEMLEYVIWRPSKRDSAEEVYKDIWNNLAGIAAAEYLMANGSPADNPAIHAMLSRLAHHGGIKMPPLDKITGALSDNGAMRILQVISSYKDERGTILTRQREILETEN